MLKDITIGQHFPGILCAPLRPAVKAGRHDCLHRRAVCCAESAGADAVHCALAALVQNRADSRQDDFEELKAHRAHRHFTAVLNLFFVTGQGSRWYTSGF